MSARPSRGFSARGLLSLAAGLALSSPVLPTDTDPTQGVLVIVETREIFVYPQHVVPLYSDRAQERGVITTLIASPARAAANPWTTWSSG